ncbi:DeoR/GlpR transcriptional regulator [Rhodospirillaceae bacterium KN72]|uniref:DeoR/GlpR transcriptional regulator n=1 Tax=Pacificispira spongiicola TaxID=2729598 RepID=A0A7Y0DXW7_9PROT|nr:DeoR/GlpR family DNA-binding transcription regulator [Pacificispira spongiicola]NMM43632.1 DeoR/GlpR transcriptional regulator [Pacificispira spongiicola]
MAGLGQRKQEERRRRLVEEITLDPGIMIRDLADKLNVSRETIRRDFDALCDSGVLQRRYGGAAILPSGNSLSFEARQARHVTERRMIARKAVSLLVAHQVVMLSPGTTALLFAEELAKTSTELTVITNGAREALALVGNRNLRVVMAPGDLDPQEAFVWGHETTEFFSRFNADLTVFFADGLDADGVSEADSRTVYAVKAMIDNSRHTMLLIDHHRFGQHSMQKICGLKTLDRVVSDEPPDDDLVAALAENGVELIVA